MRKRKIFSSFGFTLIELTVVLGIMGILFSMAAVNYSNVQLKARDTRRKSDLKQIQSALEMYKSDNLSYPQSDSGGTIIGCNIASGPTTGCLFNDVWALNDTTYMRKIPHESRFPSMPEYSYYQSGFTYSLRACLESASDPEGINASGDCPSNKKYEVVSP